MSWDSRFIQLYGGVRPVLAWQRDLTLRLLERNSVTTADATSLVNSIAVKRHRFEGGEATVAGDVGRVLGPQPPLEQYSTNRLVNAEGQSTAMTRR
jgi:hypothetical protein